jgi:bifunctional ADP-heptose synthase (sugar kinase/adenylyltransferase)
MSDEAGERQQRRRRAGQAITKANPRRVHHVPLDLKRKDRQGRGGQRAEPGRHEPGGAAARLAGATAPEAAAQALVGRGAGSVVVTLGAADAHWLTGGTRHRLPAPEVTAVDTTGAGDVFAGVLAAALDAGTDLRTAAAWRSAPPA